MTPEERARAAWPDLPYSLVLVLGPFGSRKDSLLVNRRDGRVSTGTRGTGVCFEGSYLEFRNAINHSYSLKVAFPGLPAYPRLWSEYLAVCDFLEALPPLT